MLMIQDCSLTSYTYNRATADAIAAHINDSYFGCFFISCGRFFSRETNWRVHDPRDLCGQ